MLPARREGKSVWFALWRVATLPVVGGRVFVGSQCHSTQLKWDGVYDLDGICNRRLEPLDSAANQVLAIRQRLYLLESKTGALDNNLDDETAKSLWTFNWHWNHRTPQK